MPISETDVAGMSYILLFSNDINELTNTFASYQTIQLSIMDKYPALKKGDTAPSFTISENERQALVQVLQDLRFWIIRVQTKAMALQQKIPAFGQNDLETIYQQIKERTVINLDLAEKYVFAIHKCFVEGALEDLLVKIVDVYSKLVSNE